jgi:hypothetical protein
MQSAEPLPRIILQETDRERDHMRVTILSSRSFKAHLDVKIWYQVVIFIYQLPRECQSIFHTSQPSEPTPSSVELLTSFYIYPLPPGSRLKRIQSRAHSCLLYYQLLSSVLFVLVSSFSGLFIFWSLLLESASTRRPGLSL